MAHITFKKWTGSAGGLHDYLKEEKEPGSISDEAEAFLRYHSREDSDIVFDYVRSNLGNDFLPGLCLELGLTKGQYEQIFNGTWDGETLTRGNYRKVWQKDSRGNEVWVDDPDNPGKQTRIPVMVQKTTKGGKPRFDVEGNPLMKQQMEYVRVAGYDFPIALGKDRGEFLIANPEWVPTYIDIMHKASDLYCSLIQKHIPCVKVNGKLVKAEGLIWSSVPQFGARPTPESDRRLDGEGVADCHLHAHTFLFSMAKVGDSFKAIDGIEITRNMEWLTAAIENEISRLEMELGIPTRAKSPTRTGKRDTEIAGSNPDVRRFLSTNSSREEQVRNAFEEKYGRTWTDREKDREMQKSKGNKSKTAKEADAGGSVYWSKLRQALDDAGLEMTIAAPGQPVQQKPRNERVRNLFARMESPEGVVRDCEASSIFGPEAVLPAAFRMSTGLGFTSDEVEELAGWYLENELVTVRESTDPSARLFTTKSVLAAEKANRAWIERKKHERSDMVPEDIVERISAKYGLDPGQDKALRAACLTSSRIVFVTGKAGAGKGRTAEAITEAFREAGAVREVAAMADAAKRGNSFGDQIKAEHQGSIESVKRQVRARKWLPSSRDIAFADEVGQINSFRLRDIADASGPAKVIFFGDDKQLPAIGPAGWFEDQLADGLDGIPHAELVEVYRHSDTADKEAFDMIREGRAHAALADLAERGRIHVADDVASLVAEVMERVRLHRDSGWGADEVCIVSQGSNTVLDTINRFVQRDRVARGEVDRDTAVKVEEFSTGRRWSLMTGDLVVFNTGYWDGRRAPIRNGTTGKVIRTEGRSVRVALDTEDRRTLTLDLPEGTDVQPVAPRYAMSTAKFQGDSVKVNIVLPGNPGIATLNSGYSQVTRAVDHIDIVLDRETWSDKPARVLGKAWSQAAGKTTALTEMEHVAQEVSEDFEWELEDIDGVVYAKKARRPREEERVEEPEMATTAPSARSWIQEMRSRIDEQEQREQRNRDRGLDNDLGLGL